MHGKSPCRCLRRWQMGKAGPVRRGFFLQTVFWLGHRARNKKPGLPGKGGETYGCDSHRCIRFPKSWDCGQTQAQKGGVVEVSWANATEKKTQPLPALTNAMGESSHLVRPAPSGHRGKLLPRPLPPSGYSCSSEGFFGGWHRSRRRDGRNARPESRSVFAELLLDPCFPR